MGSESRYHSNLLLFKEKSKRIFPYIGAMSCPKIGLHKNVNL